MGAGQTGPCSKRKSRGEEQNIEGRDQYILASDVRSVMADDGCIRFRRRLSENEANLMAELEAAWDRNLVDYLEQSPLDEVSGYGSELLDEESEWQS